LNENHSIKSFKANCNKFTTGVYEDLKRALLQNKYLEVFEVFNNDIGNTKEMELAEIIIKKSTERKDKTFVSCANLDKYLEEQKKAKEPKQPEPVVDDKTAKPGEVTIKAAEGADMPSKDSQRHIEGEGGHKES
jgi:hypothetical protein